MNKKGKFKLAQKIVNAVASTPTTTTDTGNSPNQGTAEQQANHLSIIPLRLLTDTTRLKL